jgi:hypothetical protein
MKRKNPNVAITFVDGKLVTVPPMKELERKGLLEHVRLPPARARKLDFLTALPLITVTSDADGQQIFSIVMYPGAR